MRTEEIVKQIEKLENDFLKTSLEFARERERLGELYDNAIE